MDMSSQALVKRLMARKRFVPWGGNKEFKAPAMPLMPSCLAPAEEPPEEVGPPSPPGADDRKRMVVTAWQQDQLRRVPCMIDSRQPWPGSVQLDTCHEAPSQLCLHLLQAAAQRG